MRVRPTIRQATTALRAATRSYSAKLDQYREDPQDTRKADEAVRALAKWEEVYDVYRRVRREADWRRARRLLQLARHDRHPKELDTFVEDHYQVWRE